MSNNFVLREGLEVANGVVIQSGGLTVTNGDISLPDVLRIGAAAGANRFPNATVSISKITIPTKPNELHNIGLVSEGLSDPINTAINGVGVYGVGYTAGGTLASGVVGEGHVSDTSDSGSSIGVRGYAIDTHGSGSNIGLFGTAANGLTNYALYMATGDIFSGSSQQWKLNGDLTFTGSHRITTPTLIASTINNISLTTPINSATLTLANNSSLITTGGHSTTLNITGTTNITLPESGTLLTSDTAFYLGETQVTLGRSSGALTITNLNTDGYSGGLKTATGSVVVSAATAPSAGQVLTAIDGVSASWQNQSGGGGVGGAADALNTATGIVTVSAAAAPSTGQILTASNSTTASWIDPLTEASSLKTVSGIVTVSAATAPSAGQVLTAVDGTSASWQDTGTTITDSTGTGSKVVYSISPEITTSLTTDSTSFDLVNTTATTVNIAGAATTVSMSGSTGTTTINNDLAVSGNITYGAGATQLSATVININDPLVFLASNNSSDIMDIGFVGGYNDNGLKHTGFIRDATDKAWKLFSNASSAVNSVIDLTAVSYDDLVIGGLTATSFNKVAITQPSTSATITIADGKAITTADSFTTSGAFPITLTATASTGITLPTSGTLLTDGSTVFNKVTITAPANSATITIADGKAITTADSFTTAGAFPITLTATASTGITLPTSGTLLTDGSSVFNKVTITAPANSATITIADGKAITTADSFTTAGAFPITLTATEATTVTLPASGTLDVDGYATSATAAGTTTLTKSSASTRVFTGTATETVILPSTADLYVGKRFTITNNSTGSLSVQDSATTAVLTQTTKTTATYIVSDTATQGWVSWQTSTDTTGNGITDSTGTGTVVMYNESPIIKTSLVTHADSTSFDLINTVATTVNFAGAGTAISIGSNAISTNTYLKNSTVVFGNTNATASAITTPATTFNLINDTATTVNFARAATSITMGAVNSTTTIGGSLAVTGGITVNGGVTLVNTSTVNVADPMIRMASGNTTDAVDIGIVGKYNTTKFTGFVRDASDGIWKLFNELVPVDGNGQPTDPGNVLDFSQVALGYAPIKVGALTAASFNKVSVTATLNGSTLAIADGKAITTADSFTTAGAFPITLTATASTGITLPTSGTLLTDGSTVFNKVTITAPANSATITIADGKAITTADSFTTAGAFPITLTATASTSVALPTSGTLVADGYTTTATAAGTTVLTASSTSTQVFTGTLAQTVTLPSTSALTIGRRFTIINSSSVALTIQDGATPTPGAVATQGPNTTATYTVAATLTQSWVHSITAKLNSGSTISIPANKSITTADSFTTAGAFPITLTATASTSLTLPDSGRLVADGYTTTATAAGTTTLTATSTLTQVFTGTTTQTVKLPSTSGLTLGRRFTITNKSTGALAIQNGATPTPGAVATQGPYTTATYTVAAIGTESWVYDIIPVLNSGAITGLKESKVTLTSSDVNIDLATGNFFSRTVLAAGVTFTVSNVPSAGTVASFILEITNGGAGQVTFWAGVKWASASAPALSTTGRDVLGFYTHDGGSIWTGLLLGKDIR